MPHVLRRLLRAPHALLAVVLALGLVTATAPAASAEQVEREISINAKEPQENKFIVKGKISPSTGKPVNAIIEVKHCKKAKDCGAAWKRFAKIKTNKKGRYSERVKGPKKGHQRVYYRVATKENDKFFAAVSPEIYIYRLF
ncbi:hypothetical protein [uncultured Nocardioides sp.]|uniref:hypothetical protein n=1 Tax=uncultured Nocardioides sp. TaxID=198441 RepID=UPI000C697D21|nr:hypothetical protein [Nocardioides sp.]|tara:strand:+ start:1369 stop:1791 length:423 start_codon:yes stop_codon:yes gene_type:complete